MNSMNGGSRWQWIAGTCLAARMSFMATLGPHTPLPPLPPTYAHPLKLHYHTSVHSLKLCVEKSQEIIRKKCWKQASTSSPVFSQYLQSNRDGWPTFGKDFPFCLICVIGPHLIHIMVMWKVNYLVFHHSRLSGCYELARNHTNSLLWKTLKLCARWRALGLRKQNANRYLASLASDRTTRQPFSGSPQYTDPVLLLLLFVRQAQIPRRPLL